jgi:hypothetical protein
MRSKQLRVSARWALWIVLTTLIWSPWTTTRADEDHEWSVDAETLDVRNLIGEIEVTQAGGDEFIIKAHVRGKDSDSEKLDFDLDEGSEAEFTVGFPVDEYDRFRYPEAHGKSTFSDWESHSGSLLSKLFRFATGDKITVSNKSGDVEIWCDLEIGVPTGKALRVHVGVGDMSARDTEGHVYLSCNSGSVTMESCSGVLTGDTGSGHVRVYDVEGEIVMDTGSGHVKGERIRGDEVRADTGSGHVELADVECEILIADTGSGHVDIVKAEADEISVDTGSGNVTLHRIRGRDVLVDTGSGNVEVDLLETPAGRLVVDTGSGGIRINLPPDPSCTVHAETASGRVVFDVSDASNVKRDDDEIRLTIGDGAMKIRLDSGSGNVRIEES